MAKVSSEKPKSAPAAKTPKPVEAKPKPSPTPTKPLPGTKPVGKPGAPGKPTAVKPAAKASVPPTPKPKAPPIAKAPGKIAGKPLPKPAGAPTTQKVTQKPVSQQIVPAGTNRNDQGVAAAVQASGADRRDVALGTANGKDIKLSFAKRKSGIAVIGKTGTGKSNLIKTMITQEVQMANAVTIFLFDPHGDLAKSLLATKGKKEVLFISPDTKHPFGLNLLEADPNNYEAVERTVSVAIEIFKKIIGQDSAFMPRFEYIFGSIARTIIYSREGLTLAEVPLLLTDLQFSRNVARNLENPELRHFWQEYEKSFWDKSGKVARPYDQFMYLESVSNRISTLLQNELLYRIVSHSQSTIRFDNLINSTKCILISLPMGKLGKGAVSLLGSILLAKLAEAIYQRGTEKRRVHVYIDEYGQYFATPFTADLLMQGRKYACSCLVSMQTLDQLPDDTNKAAVLNAGNLLVFATIGKDADTLSRQFPLPGALPEKTDVMAPYIISPTPVEDIWRKGHNSPYVMEIRDKLFILLHRMETQPYEKVFPSPELNTDEGRKLQKRFRDMENYCTSREQIVEAFNRLNEVFVACQNFTQTPAFNYQDWVNDLFAVFLLLRGYLGFYPQNRKDETGEYAEWVERRVEKGVLDPRRLEQGFEWKPLSIPKADVLSLYDLFALSLAAKPEDKELFQEKLAHYALHRNYLKGFPSIVQLFKFEGSLPTEQEERDGYFQRSLWEWKNLAAWARRFLYAVNDLSEMPVLTQSSTYAGQRTDRPVGDMREELSMRLATLPNYTAMCNLLQESGSIQTVLLKCLKG